MRRSSLLVLCVCCAAACQRPNPDYVPEGADLARIDLSEEDLSSISDGGMPPDDLGLPPNVITIDEAVFAEGDTGESVGTFTVRLSSPSTGPVTVMATTTDGNAIQGQDYEATTGTVTFAPGELTATFAVSIIGDTLPETDETFVVHLTDAVGATIFSAYAQGTITDDDLPSLSVADTSVSEGDDGVHALSFTVTLSAASTQDVSFTYMTAQASAQIDDSDYLGVLGRITIPAGESSVTIDVPVFGDVRDETDEILSLSLSAPMNATIAQGTATGTLLDDDDAPEVSIADAAAYESGMGSSASFRVWLSAPSGRVVTVSYSTMTGSASSMDFVAKSGAVSFAPGETEKQVNVMVTNDADAETPEDFSVVLSSPVNTKIDVGTATGILYDDDSAVPALTVSSSQIDEGDAGDKTLVFTVSSDMNVVVPLSFRARTIDLSAIDGVDYQGIDQTFNILTGSSSVTVSVNIHGDTLHEANETFVLELSSPTFATLTNARTLGRIRDDDPTPVLTMTPQTQVEGDLDTALMSLPITLSAASGLEASVSVSTVSQSAVSPADYAMTVGVARIRAGVTSWAIAIPINGDALAEGDESFRVNMSMPENTQLAANHIICTITNDD